MKTNYCIIILLLSYITSAFSANANCWGPASKLAIIEFDAFPSPVNPGGTVFIRAKAQPGYDINSAKVQVSVFFTDQTDLTGLTPVLDITGLDLCTLSSKVTCPIKAQSTVFEWDFPVPEGMMPGTYQVRYIILEDNVDSNPYSCIQFSITVAGQTPDTYKSWYQATLLGTAVFDDPDYTARQVGQSVQVGPAGPLNYTSSTYGMIKGLTGSGELVPNPYYDTSKYIWGLQGTLKNVIRGAKGKVTHIYTGTCYLGYSNPGSGYDTYDHENPLIEGEFNMTWVYSNSATGQVNGYVIFSPAGTIPHGWGFPLVFGRIARHEVITSESGFLLIRGSDTFCASGLCRAANPGGASKKNGMSSDKLGLAIGLPFAVVFVICLVAAALYWVKRRRQTEQEDGVFAVARKPEYGSALVVDDIIEETRGSRTLQAMIDIQDEYSDSDDDDSASASSRSRSRTPLSRSRSASRSVSRSVSRSSRGEIRSGQDSEGDSASRSSDSD